MNTTHIKFKRFLKYYGVIISIVLSLAATGFSAYTLYIIDKKVTNTPQGGEPQFQKLTEKDIDKLIDSGAPVIGNSRAPVTIVEFADFQCPFCGRFSKEILPQIKSKYVDTGKARFVYVNFAFLGQESKAAAHASLCAKEQNKFWEYHDELYKNQSGENLGAFREEKLKEFAQNIGLNPDEFNSCMASNKFVERIEKELEFGKSLGIQGTPSTYINESLIRGVRPLNVFTEAIEQALK